MALPTTRTDLSAFRLFHRLHAASAIALVLNALLVCPAELNALGFVGLVPDLVLVRGPLAFAAEPLAFEERSCSDAVRGHAAAAFAAHVKHNFC